MRHLSPEQIVDVAEGTRHDSAFPHLTQCDECRRLVAECSEIRAVVEGVDVPEPSPLFWDALSGRVAAEVATGLPPAAGFWWPRQFGTQLVWGGSVAALLVAALIFRGAPAGNPNEVMPATAAEAPAAVTVDAGESVDLVADLDDPFSLVGELASELDWEGALEAGLIPYSTTDHETLGHLTDEERQELERLLNEELARPRETAS